MFLGKLYSAFLDPMSGVVKRLGILSSAMKKICPAKLNNFIHLCQNNVHFDYHILSEYVKVQLLLKV